jgi:hypothetical protein
MPIHPELFDQLYLKLGFPAGVAARDQMGRLADVHIRSIPSRLANRRATMWSPAKSMAQGRKDCDLLEASDRSMIGLVSPFDVE